MKTTSDPLSKCFTWILGNMDPTLTNQFYMAHPPPVAWKQTTWKNTHGALAACGLQEVFILKYVFSLQTSLKNKRNQLKKTPLQKKNGKQHVPFRWLPIFVEPNNFIASTAAELILPWPSEKIVSRCPRAHRFFWHWNKNPGKCYFQKLGISMNFRRFLENNGTLEILLFEFFLKKSKVRKSPSRMAGTLE